ncbi:MAG TPA: cysteine synthase A [Clostridiales bacterium]|nr:cysteine synthase A [Clostridiales bacterium]
MFYESVLDMIGNTNMVSLKKVTGRNIFAKAEFLNPGGSIKDRVAKNMLDKAEQQGLLKPGMTIMEPTSGNTGIGIALVGIQKGYQVTIVMPENMSEERKKIIKALGADLILTPAAENVDGALTEVERQTKNNPNIYVPNQFCNPTNPEAHYMGTGPEIWEQMEGKVDIFISGMGSGGTLQGVGSFLKEKNPDCIIVAAEPKNVSALLGHEPGFHKIQGIGDGFIPECLDTSVIDIVVEVTDDEAINTARRLAKVGGYLVGTSSGANVYAAELMSDRFGAEKRVVTVLPDRAERYFSTSLI